jgi:hypothetical protein
VSVGLGAQTTRVRKVDEVLSIIARAAAEDEGGRAAGGLVIVEAGVCQYVSSGRLEADKAL